MDYAVPADHKIKLKENKKRCKYEDLARELKKTLEHESDGDTNCNWRTRYSDKRIGKGAGRIVNKRTSGDHQNNGIIKIGQNTEKSHGDLRRPDSSEGPSANVGRKNSQRSKYYNIRGQMKTF